LALLRCPIFSPDGTKLFIKEGDYTITMIDLHNTKNIVDKIQKINKDKVNEVPDEETNKEKEK